MVLSANPEVMVSRDKNLPRNLTSSQRSHCHGRGTGTSNRHVFAGTAQYPGTYNVTNNASFSSSSAVTTTSATTDENGDATVAFYPGSFSTNLSDLRYSASATGQVTVTATWDNNGTTVTKNILIKWKNLSY